jgi:hypothetical protein
LRNRRLSVAYNFPFLIWQVVVTLAVAVFVGNSFFRNRSILILMPLLAAFPAHSQEDLSKLPYQFAPEPGTYTCEASHRQTLRQGLTDAAPELTKADTTFNWGVRRGDLLLVSGDFPRFAFLTRRREARSDPPPIKVGDARLRLETAQGVFRWEDASSITATFHPTYIEHDVRWAKLPGVVGHLRVGLAGGSEAVALASIKVEAGASFSGFLDLDFGGITTHGRTFSAAYFPPDSPDDPRTTVTLSEDGGVLSCPDYPERVAFRFEGHPKVDAAGGRISAKWPVNLAGDGHFEAGSTWKLSSSPTQTSPPAPPAVTATFTNIEADDTALLAKTVATTPDGYIGPGLNAAVLTLENCWDRFAWLEGVHWWSCYWTNNYQISAAIALGQWDRARRALEFFLDDKGQCPARFADGSRRADSYGALPFWLHQLAAYVDATGDRALVLQLRPNVEKGIATMLAEREKEPGGLLSWLIGANSTVYQADHLGWPGEATSVSFLTARALRDWGHLCQEAGDASAGASWAQKADHLEQLARARLWDEERGCFFSHRDDENHTFRSHYYSDHVYPALYGTILSAPEAASVLEVLREELIYETPAKRLLMRVGTYKPAIFSNDNVMPTQMAETAVAFERLGQNETAARLLHSVALAATLDTESPGSFCERFNDLGKGEANYGFGNPSGAYAMAVINGLFGVALREGGTTCQWNPSFPDDWPSAQLHLPWVDLGYSRSSTSDGGETRKYDYTWTQPRQLQFRVFLPVADAYHVVVDQRETNFTLAPGVGGTWLTLASYSTQKSSIEISFSARPVNITGPGVVTFGTPATWQIPTGPITLDDPANSLTGMQLNEGKLTGIPRPPYRGFERRSTIYATLKSPPTIVPIAFTAVPPVALAGADLVVEGTIPDSASATLRLNLRPGPGTGNSANLIVDLGGNHSVVPWHGEEAISVRVPAPRSGRVLAAIPLQLRVRLESPTGSTWMNRQLIITPHGADSAAETALRDGRARQANPVSLEGLPQSSTLLITFPWRYTPKFDLQLRAHAVKGFESDGELFPVRADGDSFCLVDGGASDIHTRLPLPSTAPKSMVVPINRRVCAISMLFASEMEMRLSESCVGEIKFTYSQGPDEIVPLVADANFDALRGHSAPECAAIKINDKGDKLNLLRLPCDGTRKLDHITVTMQERDARLALIALHTFAVGE